MHLYNNGWKSPVDKSPTWTFRLRFLQGYCKFTRFRDLKTNVRKRPFDARLSNVCTRHTQRMHQTIDVIFTRLPFDDGHPATSVTFHPSGQLVSLNTLKTALANNSKVHEAIAN